MANGQYCIVDNTIDPNVALEGLLGLTIEQAEVWIGENQVELDAPLTVEETTYTHKFAIQPDNWPAGE